MKYPDLRIIDEIFRMLSVALPLFVVMEIMKPGIVLAYININWVLILWLAVGILIMLLKDKKGND